MNDSRRQHFILALAGTLFALGIHLWNNSLSNLESVHTTADDASYLRPAENFADHGTWKDNSEGASAFVQRPPLMGLIHLPFYVIFGKSAATATMVFFFFLHGLALYQLPVIFKRFVPKRALLFSWMYALLPCFWGFLSYQITEALSPSLVILLIAAALHTGKYSLATLLFLLLCSWMLRPVLILLFPIAVYTLFKRRKELFSKKLWWNPLVLICSLACIVLWESRKADYTGSWGNVHPIYHASNVSVFRPVHASLTAVFRAWETKPEILHAFVASCWTSDSSFRSDAHLRNYISERGVPLAPERLHAVLNEYANVNRELIELFQKGPLTKETPAEIRLRHQLDLLADSIRKAEPLHYQVLTPLQGAREQLTKSQLNLELFQVHYRGLWWTELLRWLCVLVITVSLLFTLLSFFSGQLLLKWLALGAMLFLFCLFYVQRLNEDRYLIPLLPLILITGMSSLGILLEKLSVRSRSGPIHK